MKDIFIDNNIAKNFTNPLDPEYKKLIAWLLKEDKVNPVQNAILIVSQKLLNEYYASAQNAHTDTCIPVIIDTLTRQGRRIFVTNEEIKVFHQNHFSKKVRRKLRSNHEDRNHIPLVLLSQRKYALALDDNFIFDLVHFPGFVVTVSKRPEQLPYSI